MTLAHCLAAPPQDTDLLRNTPLERPHVVFRGHATMVRDDCESPALAALDARLVQMRLETPSIRAHLSALDASRAVTASRAYLDARTQTQTLEFVTSTPFACSVAALETHFWHQLAKTKDHHNKHDAKHRVRALLPCRLVILMHCAGHERLRD